MHLIPRKRHVLKAIRLVEAVMYAFGSLQPIGAFLEQPAEAKKCMQFLKASEVREIRCHIICFFALTSILLSRIPRAIVYQLKQSRSKDLDSCYLAHLK